MLDNLFPNLKAMMSSGKIKCPDCDLLMRPYRCENIIVDKCIKCAGLWFDPGEFGIFKESLNKISSKKIVVVSDSEESQIQIISGCPRCNEPLSEVNSSYNSKLKMKRCESCRGIWLPQISYAPAADISEISKEVRIAFERLKQDRELTEFGKIMSEPPPEFKSSYFPVLSRQRQYRSFLFLNYPLTFIPFYDNNPRSKFPFVTCLLIAINLLIFFLMAKSSVPISEICYEYGMIPSRVIDGESYSILFSSFFMHTGFFHLAFNMLFLWIFGDNVEEFLGSIPFLLFYLACGLFVNIIDIFSNINSTIPSVGASGAIAGILGSYLVLFRAKTITTVLLGVIIDVPVWIYLGSWFGYQIVLGVIYFGFNIPSPLAWSAHISGFVFGLIFTVAGQKLRLIRKRFLFTDPGKA